MSTKHIDAAVTLVRFGASLQIDCGCGATRTLSAVEAVQRCGRKDARLTVLPPI